MKTGFTFQLGNKDVFIITKRQRKTETLASAILRKLEKPDNPSIRKQLLDCLRKATLEMKTLSNGNQYYEISGDGFGGRGSFINDGKTVIINLEGGEK